MWRTASTISKPAPQARCKRVSPEAVVRSSPESPAYAATRSNTRGFAPMTDQCKGVTSSSAEASGSAPAWRSRSDVSKCPEKAAEVKLIKYRMQGRDGHPPFSHSRPRPGSGTELLQKCLRKRPHKPVVQQGRQQRSTPAVKARAASLDSCFLPVSVTRY